MRIYNLMLISILPFIYGCLSGGGGGSAENEPVSAGVKEEKKGDV